jgi:hypothetical protein
LTAGPYALCLTSPTKHETKPPSLLYSSLELGNSESFNGFDSFDV